MIYRIFPPEELLEARVTLPLSKSMSNRELLINALTPDDSPLPEVAQCDDTDAMVRALISGPAQVVNVGAAGTTMRFLTAYYAVTPGQTVVLDGSERMRKRPIKVLVDALRELGADIEYAGEEGFPPLRITGRRLKGGSITLDSSVSSQYISALMMTAPVMDEGLRITLEGETVSRPYLRMTLSLMAKGGVEGEYDTTGMHDVITIPHGVYTAGTLPPVEGDWSAAAAWYEMVALSSGFVTIDNLTRESCQGDRALADIFAKIGVNTEWEGENGGIDLLVNPDGNARLNMDFADTPDLAQYTVVTCAMLNIPFRFTGLRTLAIKETDRVNALIRELAKVGFILTQENVDTLSWEGQRVPIQQVPVFDTYEDHRMAMCLAPISLFLPGIVMRDVEVVSKSYPGFWDDLRAAGFTLVEMEPTA